MTDNASGRLRLRLGKTADPQAVLAAAQKRGPVIEFRFEQRRLSEVFREAVGSVTGWAAIRLVAEREIRERFRSKVFRASTVISALVVIAIIVIPNIKATNRRPCTTSDSSTSRTPSSKARSGVGPRSAPTRARAVTSPTRQPRSVGRSRATSTSRSINGRRIIVDNGGRLRRSCRNGSGLQLAVSEAARLPIALTEAGLSR